MSKKYLKQILTYINKVYDIGEKINTLKDKRIKSPVKISTISFVTLFGFMLQIRSFNRGCFKIASIRGFRKKRMLQIDIIEDLRDEMLSVQNWKWKFKILWGRRSYPHF